MKALVERTVSREAAGTVMGCSVERAERLVDALAADGLVAINGSRIDLP
jgi:hypothetical protein